MSFLDVEGGIGKGKDNGEKTRGTDEEILKLFYEIEELTVKEAEKLEDLPNCVLIQDAVDAGKGPGGRARL